MPNLRPVKMIDLQGNVLRRFTCAKETAQAIGISWSVCRKMLTGLRGKNKPYKLEYDDGLPVRRGRGKSRTGDVFREIEKFHEQINGKPIERICMMCNKTFKSIGNRRCDSCNLRSSA